MVGRGWTAEEERFYSELINKENLQRLDWFVKHGGYEEAQRLLDEQKMEEETKKLDSKALSERMKPDRVLTTAVMRPVEEHIRKVLYKGTSYSGEGRKKYLDLRYEKSPKQKFYFADCSNWDYGWATDGEMLEIDDDKKGRVGTISECFYRRGGVGEDPPHYRAPINMRALFPYPSL